MKTEQVKTGIIGLGYVGLPLAVEFGRTCSTVGFDICSDRVEELRRGTDSTCECSSDELASAAKLTFSDDMQKLAGCNVYIVAVPTPVDRFKKPDLTPLLRASETVGQVISKGDVVIYESTVYPGATEEECIPVIERVSGLRFNRDFFAGYSPERINPGDKEHRVTDIKKVTSGSTPETAEFVDRLYAGVIRAGTHRAPSIRAAEAAKVIENTQRDVNIALINELSMLFNRLGIDTLDVLEAAETKWNFLPFRPGLVGGHCIGVDPYYLTHKAQQIGFHPEMILAGRRTNDGMANYVVSQTVKLMLSRGLAVRKASVLIMGMTFKENCPDVRNTRVSDMVREFKEYGCDVDICDPRADAAEVRQEYGFPLISGIGDLRPGSYDAIVLAVAHYEFKAMGPEAIRGLLKPDGVLYDIKYIVPKEHADGRL